MLTYIMAAISQSNVMDGTDLAQSHTDAALPPIQVFMMDLLSIVPYYTGHLCPALEKVEGLRVKLGSITYHLDRDFFNRQGIRTYPGAFDLISKVDIKPAWVRRIFKTAEWVINLAALGIRFTFSKPDILHAQFLPMISMGLPLEIWFLKLAKLRGIKIVYTVHNILPHDSGQQQKAAFRTIYSLADRLICHDEPARNRLAREFGIDDKKISIVPHGPLFDTIPPAVKGRARQRLNIGQEQVMVLWQGILRPYKGVPFLLEAWPEVMRTISPAEATLAIVGSGDEHLMDGIRRQVAAMNNAKTVRLDLRFVPVEEMNELYGDADIVVYPYSAVTTSGALMTGIGQGKAIVATSLPAFSQLLTDNVNGLLVDCGNTKDLASALGRLIQDKALRARLGKAASQAYADRNQWAEIAERTVACYRSALEAAV